MSANDLGRPDDSSVLREYLSVLRVRAWTVVLITLVALLGTLFYLQRTRPTYTSTARVLVHEPLAFLLPANQQAPTMVTEVALVSSTRYAQCAAQLYAQSTGQPFLTPSRAPAAGPLNLGFTVGRRLPRADLHAGPDLFRRRAARRAARCGRRPVRALGDRRARLDDHVDRVQLA